jgi:uncharacterized protein (TIGR02421 family)
MSSAEVGQAERIRRATRLLREAERPVRVLRTLDWPASVREQFFADRERELPRPVYATPDTGRAHEGVAAARALVDGDDVIAQWLRRQADAIERGARMLAACGTREFHEHACALYGTPRAPLTDGTSTSLELAMMLENVLADLTHIDLGVAAPARHPAEELAEQLRAEVDVHFGADAPPVTVVDDLSANAVATSQGIRLRRGAVFSDRDAAQLLQHEAFIHVATSLNGRAQVDLPVLASAHPGTTRTQEGLAVFAELISGSIEPERMMRLADRVLAIEMAMEGADFLQVYRWFVERTRGDREQAFENTRRIFRGGVLAGGAPFTKDVVYLDGLLRVHNFLRAAVSGGRSDCVHLLFCGKLDLEDVPALGQLAARGLCAEPRFLPPWARDLRFLVSYLTFSAFLDRVELSRIRAHYADVLAETPQRCFEVTPVPLP